MESSFEPLLFYIEFGASAQYGFSASAQNGAYITVGKI